MGGFKRARVYVEGEGLKRRSIRFGEYILSVENGEGEGIELPEDCVVLPGFIDEHIHGAGGADAMDASEEALSVIADTVAREGTTSFLATTMTQSVGKISAALRAVAQYRAGGRTEGARLAGVHLEGPFLSARYKGAQAEEFLAAPSVELFDAFQAESGGCIRLVTLAPEAAGAEELISHLVKAGVAVSIGHSAAGVREVERAAELGARSVTHVFNAQSAIHHREIGVAGGALLFDGLTCELIADMIHVSCPAVRLLVKNKPRDRIALITDSIRAKGTADGVSELGGQKVFVKDGEARLEDGTLAGSVLKMNDAIRNMVEKAGVPFLQAVDHATANPARTLGVFHETGGIRTGKRADFAVLDASYGVVMTVRDGKVIYRA